MSGLSHTPGKRAKGYTFRGFESRLLRQLFLKSLKRLSMRIKTGTTPILIAILAAIASTAAYSQTKDELFVASLSATCASCHGTLGKAANGSSVVGLAGLSKDYIVTQMTAFKTGTRPATVMHQLSKGYSDAQIAQIATYFAAQSK
jgi:cytochrome subunit of sulfide dehydrogenase